MSDLSGQHAIVSGGGTGVGAAIAMALAGAGASVTVIGRRAESLAQVAGQAAGIGWALCDVTDAAAMADMMAQDADRHGPARILVANAGSVQARAFARTSAADMAETLAVNLTGVFTLWQAGLAGMQGLGGGRMIAIASTAGLKGYAYVAPYCAAKHGVIGLTRALAQELAQTGITVNAICPGYTETPLLERAVANIVDKTGRTRDEAVASLKAGNPQGRFIQPAEVAAAVLWLCSAQAGSVNGQAIAISGGET